MKKNGAAGLAGFCSVLGIILGASALLTPCSARAEAGTFPTSTFNGMQIEYSIVGVSFPNPPTNTYSFETSRVWTNGFLRSADGPGYVRISGIVRNTHNELGVPGGT